LGIPIFPVILVKTAAATRAHGGKGGRICLLKPIIRAAQNFIWWIWEKDLDFLILKNYSQNEILAKL
jgi:hypothetical protein